jgi:hypothetical protein
MLRKSRQHLDLFWRLDLWRIGEPLRRPYLCRNRRPLSYNRWLLQSIFLLLPPGIRLHDQLGAGNQQRGIRSGRGAVGRRIHQPYFIAGRYAKQLRHKTHYILTVLVLYGINFLGIKLSARTQNVLTIFKAGMIVVLCTAIFKSDAVPAHTIAATPHSGNVITAFGLSLVAVFLPIRAMRKPSILAAILSTQKRTSRGRYLLG